MDQIHHFLHSHPLMLNEVEVSDEVVCSGCEQVLEGPIYGCSDCMFYLHKSCAYLPEQIQCFFHPCPLVLDIIRWYSCNACFQDGSGFSYSCRRCDIHRHVKCSLRPTPTMKAERAKSIQHITHRHPLTLVDQKKDLEVRCSICEKLCPGSSHSSVYGCEKCNFFLHDSCMVNIPRHVNHLFHPSCPLYLLLTDEPYRCHGCDEPGSGLAFGCSKCNFHLDVKCAILPAEKSKRTDKIQHSAHPHPLALRENTEFGSEVRCRACGEKCSGPCFICERCDFFFHKQCAVELRQEIDHQFHPLHPLILSSLSPDHNTFECLACGDKDDRFLLFHRCAKCDFNLHAACAKSKPTPFIVLYEGHSHFLTFFDKTRAPFVCNICNQKAKSCFFRCVACEFDIHLYCFPSAPKTIQHKSHLHPLTLTASPFEYEFTSPQYRDNSEDEKFYCDVCEEERYKGESVYYCKDCEFIAEVRCVISELLPSIKQSSMTGRVISRDEKNSAIQASIAKLSDEIAKLRAKEEPLEAESEKLLETLRPIKRKLKQLETDLDLYVNQLNQNKAPPRERLPPIRS